MQEIWTILVGMAPFSESRGAIPLGIFAFGFSPLKAYLLGVLGNIIVIAPVLLFLNYFSKWLMQQSYWFNRFFSWLFAYTRDRYVQKFAQKEEEHHHSHFWQNWWREIALLIFVAVPLPMTGVWSGCLVAFVFGLSLKRAAIAIASGAATAGLIVLLVSLGLLSGLKIFS